MFLDNSQTPRPMSWRLVAAEGCVLKTRTERRAAGQGHPGYGTSDDVANAQYEVLTPKEERVMTRAAIRRALVECDYLSFTRRRIPLPITRQKSANIT